MVSGSLMAARYFYYCDFGGHPYSERHTKYSQTSVNIKILLIFGVESVPFGVPDLRRAPSEKAGVNAQLHPVCMSGKRKVGLKAAGYIFTPVVGVVRNQDVKI